VEGASAATRDEFELRRMGSIAFTDFGASRLDRSTVGARRLSLSIVRHGIRADVGRAAMLSDVGRVEARIDKSGIANLDWNDLGSAISAKLRNMALFFSD
jgi:hypothetical protein